jgi:hypothetical protein
MSSVEWSLDLRSQWMAATLLCKTPVLFVCILMHVVDMVSAPCDIKKLGGTHNLSCFIPAVGTLEVGERGAEPTPVMPAAAAAAREAMDAWYLHAWVGCKANR